MILRQRLLLAFIFIISFDSINAQPATSAIKEVYKNGNPIVPYVGMADPHIFIINNRAYLYTTRDIDSLQTKKDFVMPDWHIWSSDDLIHWNHEQTILPTETYMGASMDCWATDLGWRNGKYFFYFSNKNISTGVMVSDSPIGPFKDILGKPLLAPELTTSKEYDPTILMDDDTARTAYIAFGHHRDNDSLLGYYIAKLNEDMVSLAEQPKKIYFSGKEPVLFNDDKPNLHKYNGVYYLSSGAHYSTSENIYGPYVKRGNSGHGKYGLTAQAHGNYFMWNNQWFHTWCKFHLGKEVAKYRESYLTYVHYKKDGTMVDDTLLLSKHFQTGVGQYDANWDQIEAEWYMRGNGMIKGESETGNFEIQACYSKGYLFFPNLHNLENKKHINFRLKPIIGGQIRLRDGGPSGTILATVRIPSAKQGKGAYSIYSSTLNLRPSSRDLYIEFLGKGAGSLFSIDWFGFD